jgi:hypothetical protein
MRESNKSLSFLGGVVSCEYESKRLLRLSRRIDVCVMAVRWTLFGDMRLSEKKDKECWKGFWVELHVTELWVCVDTFT